MTGDHLLQIQSGIKNPFYYIDFPDNVSPGWWKDGAGEWKHMSDMGLDHLKACTKKVESDIAYWERSGRPAEVITAIVPLARQKLKELKDAFGRKVDE